MSLPLVFRPEVQAEMQEAFDWYERRRTGLGEELIARIEEVLEQVGQTPEIHPVVFRDVRVGLPRRFPYGVYYQKESDRILVIAVMHTRRDPHAWQSRV